ncbi:site-specific integrase, partial [Azospirillum brasilense]
PPVPLAADGLPDAAALGAKARAYAARAPATLRAYRAAWAAYTRWCGWLGVDPLGGDPYVIGMYLAHCADRLKLASIRLQLAALAEAHRRAGRPFDRRHPDIARVLDGIAGTLGSAPRQVAPVHGDALRAMLAALPAGAVGVRDRALLLVGFGAALRRSELVGLDLEDVQISAEGVRVRLRRSKTDPTGAGAVVAIRRGRSAETCAAAALEAWLRLRGGAPGPLFQAVVKGGRVRPQRLSAMAVVRAVKGAAARAGLDPATVSGHSLRAGLATAAAQAGAPLLAIMAQTRHRSVQVARGYVRDAELWRDNVTDQLL